MFVLAVLVLAGCSTRPASSGDLDLRTGCSSVVAERINLGAQVVTDVHAVDCRDPNRRPLAHNLAVDRVAQAVWKWLELPVDAVHVTISVTGTSPDDSPSVLTADELAARFGPGPSGVVWPVPERSNETIWVLLPVAYLATGLVMLLMVRRLRRAGVVVVLLRR